MKILIVEDEKKILSFLKKGFSEHNIVSDVSSSGEEAIILVKKYNYDCVILDLILPDLSGYDVLEAIKRHNKSLSVIILSALDSVSDKVKGLNLGADDYLSKPFAFSELLARVRAQARKKVDEINTEYQVKSIYVNTLKRTVLKDLKEIDLTPKEFFLFQYMLEHINEVVTKTMLLENVWGYSFDTSSNIVDVHITNLRKKLKDCDQSIIKTIRGVGYIIDEK